MYIIFFVLNFDFFFFFDVTLITNYYCYNYYSMHLFVLCVFLFIYCVVYVLLDVNKPNTDNYNFIVHSTLNERKYNIRKKIRQQKN